MNQHPRWGRARAGGHLAPDFDRALHIDRACDDFEARWRAGRRPRIEDYLVGIAPAERPEFLRQLMDLEIGLAREDARADYQARFPDQAAIAAELLAEPSEAARFQIVEPHAEGNMGVVFKAEDLEVGRPVALKQIKDDLSRDPAMRARFLREATLTGRLQHPGVLPVYGLGCEADDRPYYAMRFVDVPSLRDAIRRLHGEAGEAPPPSRRDLLNRLVAACNTLAYAHGQGVIHRDLKPEHILLGDFGETLVVDWGLARRLDADEGVDDRWPGHGTSPDPAATIPCGSPAYMAPEQFEGRAERLGPRSDVYSLGATLYCLLTGRPPVQGDPTEDVRANARAGRFPPPRAVDRSIPRALQAICLKAMAAEPADRYESASALARDIERWLANEPVSVYRDPLTTRAARWMGRHRVIVTAAAVGAALALPGLAAFAAYERYMVGQVERARGSAEHRFGLARDAVRLLHRGVVEDVHLRQKPLTDLREKLLGSARDFYRKLADDPADDPDRRRELAEALGDLADITAQIGDKRGALDAYTRALDALSPRRPTDAAELRLRARIQRGIAWARQDMGEPDRARSGLEDARALLRRAADLGPDDAGPRVELAQVESALGDLLRATDRPDEAREAYRRALELRQVLADSTASLDTRRELAETHITLATLEFAMGRMDEGIQQIRPGCELLKALHAEKSSDARVRVSLGKGLYNLGIAEQSVGRTTLARGALREALKIRRDLAKEHPVEPEFGGDVALTLMSIGLCDLGEGLASDAASVLQEAVGLQRPLAEGHPEDLQYRSDLSAMLDNLGTARRDLGDPDGAQRAYAEALALREDLIVKDPSRPVFQSDLADTLGNIARLHVAAGRGKEALPLLRRSVEIRGRLKMFGSIMLYNSACEIGMMVPLVSPDKAPGLADEAAKMLADAVHGGFQNLPQIQSDMAGALAPIRDRVEIKALLEELGRDARAGGTTPAARP